MKSKYTLYRVNAGCQYPQVSVYPEGQAFADPCCIIPESRWEAFLEVYRKATGDDPKKMRRWTKITFDAVALKVTSTGGDGLYGPGRIAVDSGMLCEIAIEDAKRVFGVELLPFEKPKPVRQSKKKAERDIPNTNEIHAFFHCSRCLPFKPGDKSPREFGSLEVGWTDLGIQVWCKRCEINVVHIDFGGMKVRANSCCDAPQN